MMDLIVTMKDVHENAKAHGWWEGKRTERSVRALIVSEWAEALEEDREGRPLVWHQCNDAGHEKEKLICEEQKDCPCKADSWEQDCAAYGAKPEGIATELVDGCIRILDYLGYLEYEPNLMPETMEDAIRRGRMLIEQTGIPNKTGNDTEHYYRADNLPADELVDLLTEKTMESTGGYGKQAYVNALCVACAWVNAHDVNVETLLERKHRYNKTRAYKHGKKY